MRKSRYNPDKGVIHDNLKECSLCKLYKPLDKYRIRKGFYKSGKDLRLARCKECEQHMNKIQCDPVRRKERERERNSEPKTKERKNKFQREWRKNNTEKNRAYHKKNIKKNVETASDLYISRLIFHTKSGIIVPPELIKLKRTQLIAKRTLKTIKNESHRVAQPNVGRTSGTSRRED